MSANARVRFRVDAGPTRTPEFKRRAAGPAAHRSNSDVYASDFGLYEARAGDF